MGMVAVSREATRGGGPGKGLGALGLAGDAALEAGEDDVLRSAGSGFTQEGARGVGLSERVRGTRQELERPELVNQSSEVVQRPVRLHGALHAQRRHMRDEQSSALYHPGPTRPLGPPPLGPDGHGPRLRLLVV